MLDNLKDIRIILGSQSPRRKALLQDLGIDFDVEVRETSEDVRTGLSAEDVVREIAIDKVSQFTTDHGNDLVICADTIVVTKTGKILGKPTSEEEAITVLTALSGTSHLVMTGVALLYKGEIKNFVEKTMVYFYPLSRTEIVYYVSAFQPFDKAGSYGIQEWIGRAAIKRIDGEYSNVVGLPTARLYQELKNLK